MRRRYANSTTVSPQTVSAVGLDAVEMLGGFDWEREITHAITHSKKVLVCLTPRFSASRGYAQRELSIALDIATTRPVGSVFVVPVELEKCSMPYKLKHLHFDSLVEPDGYEKLKQSLRHVA